LSFRHSEILSSTCSNFLVERHGKMTQQIYWMCHMVMIWYSDEGCCWWIFRFFMKVDEGDVEDDEEEKGRRGIKKKIVVDGPP